MYSKNKAAMTPNERIHVAKIKSMDCIVCEHPAPSEAHEIDQGQWFTTIPLCADCHRGSFNGLHGQRRIWHTLKVTELSALNETIKTLLCGRV